MDQKWAEQGPKMNRKLSKIGQNWVKNISKIDQKVTKNRPKMDQTIGKNGPKFDQKWIINESKCLKKWTKNGPKNLPKMVQNGSKMDQKIGKMVKVVLEYTHEVIGLFRIIIPEIELNQYRHFCSFSPIFVKTHDTLPCYLNFLFENRPSRKCPTTVAKYSNMV